MSDGQLSILTDHESSNRLSLTESSRYLTVNLQYTDRREGIEELIQDVRFLPTVTIRDVIRELLKRCQLEHKRPEDITLIEITHDKRYSTPVENAHLTLSALNIDDGYVLCFQPSITSVIESPSYLSIWGPNTVGTVGFKWFKTTTTLGMLLEYVIEKLSLESIERERIHLFYQSNELNLSLDYDKLLRELAISETAFIDVEIIPPISRQISSSTTKTLEDLLSLHEKSVVYRSLLTDPSASILVGLQYTDHSQNLYKKEALPLLPTTKIDDLIVKFLIIADLKHISSKDVDFVGFGIDRKRVSVLPEQRHKTLKELEIQNSCTLYFEPSTISTSKEPWFLTIQSLDDFKKVKYEWHKTRTTLGMLLDYIIKEFSLQSIEPKHIRLTTLADKPLDHTLYSRKLLCDLGLNNSSSVDVKILLAHSSSTDNERSNVRVECTHTNGTELLYVPNTTTIEELKIQIEAQFKDYLITECKLFDRMHNIVDMSKPTQPLSDFGIEPAQIVYAALKLIYSRNPLSRLNTGSCTTPRSSSLIAKQQVDEVTVVVKVSTRPSSTVKVSENDTVADLLKKLETFKENRSLAQFDMWYGSNNIHTDQPNRRLSDFGVLAGDTIDATLIEKSTVKYRLDSSHGSTSLILDNLPRSQRYTSRPLGLVNLGNTCYMNSALQCLAHTKPLTQFFLEVLTQSGSEDEKGLVTEWNQFYTIGSVTGAYADVIRNLYLPSQSSCVFSSYRPSHIKETIGLQAPRFATYDQQDAQEFLTYLLDEIHKEIKEKNGGESNTIIEELFFGKLLSTVTCQECQHQVKTTNVFSLLPLPLNQQGSIFIVKFIGKDGISESADVHVPDDGQVKSIVHAFIEARPSSIFIRPIIVMTDDGQLDLEMPLNQLSAREVMLIEQDEYITGMAFDRMFKSSKKLTLEKCLRDFCIIENLEDSWLCQQETCKKLTKATKQLQFSSLPSILIIQFKRFSHDNGLRQKIGTFVEYPTKGLDLTSFLSSSSDEAIYDLFAVSNHIGSIYGGHYIAYAQHESTGKAEWQKFDDSWVSSCWSESEIISKDAYLLFYMRRDKPKQSTSVTTS